MVTGTIDDLPPNVVTIPGEVITYGTWNLD